MFFLILFQFPDPVQFVLKQRLYLPHFIGIFILNQAQYVIQTAYQAVHVPVLVVS